MDDSFWLGVRQITVAPSGTEAHGATENVLLNQDSIVVSGVPMHEDVKSILELMKQSSATQRDDIKAIGENQMDISERVIANFAAVRTISDGSNLLRILGSDPTPCQTR